MLAGVNVEKLARIAEFDREFPRRYDPLDVESIVLLARAPEHLIREYFRWYATDGAGSIAFQAAVEACSGGVPVAFAQACVRKSGNRPPFGSTIQALYRIGGDSLDRWEKYASLDMPSWSAGDRLVLVQSRLSEAEHGRMLGYANLAKVAGGPRLGAKFCVDLCRAQPTPAASEILAYSQSFPNAPMADIIEAAIARLPVAKAREYVTRSREIQTGYESDEWSLGHIAGMYRRGITPEMAVRAWDRFPNRGHHSGFDAKKPIRAEMLALPGFLEFTDFLANNPQEITVGKRKMRIENTDVSLGLIRGILRAIEREGVGLPRTPSEWTAQVIQYARNLNEFVHEGARDEFGQVFYLAATPSEDVNRAFGSAPEYRNFLAFRYGVEKMQDLSTGMPGVPVEPMGRIERMFAYANAHPHEKILIHLAYHGGVDGSTGPFSTAELLQLAKLAQNPNVTLDIMSCFGGYKLPDALLNSANIRLSSGRHDGGNSYRELLEASTPRGPGNELPADYDGDGRVSLAEAHLYRMVHHRSNLTHDTFRTSTGEWKVV